jgi:hypothetical protein
MEEAVELLRKFIATSQERAATLSADAAAFDAFVSERGPDSPEAAARKELVGYSGLVVLLVMCFFELVSCLGANPLAGKRRHRPGLSAAAGGHGGRQDPAAG